MGCEDVSKAVAHATETFCQAGWVWPTLLEDKQLSFDLASWLAS